MQIVYAQQTLPEPNLRDGTLLNSMFLAGSEAYGLDDRSWRNKALRLLHEAGFEGAVFLPEYENGALPANTPDQAWWEAEAIALSRCYVSWVNGDIPDFNIVGTQAGISGMLAFQPHKMLMGLAPESRHYLRYKALFDDVSRLRGIYGLPPLPPRQVAQQWDAPLLVASIEGLMEAARWNAAS